MTRHRTLTLLAGSLLCGSMAAASPAQAHGAHEHGVTYLDVILDGSVLAIDLRGAGHHLAGFEHAPETGEQLEAWQATIDGLGDAGALFVLPPQAGCSLQSADVTPPAAQAASASGADAHAHDTADHDRHEHGRDHGHHHDHGHKHGNGHAKDHGHRHGGDHPAHPDEDKGDGDGHGHAADWQARYRFECRDASQLTSIEVGLFTAFPAHEEVRYQRFSDGGQDGGTLRAGRTRLPLR
ncbi:ZrgA family zinc uptake protein [Alkalisalibacterium limincola]|uniref:ZrgA family zinc uptake protein n=1 Tax=Alkalisalibacterium limincola TaxID=2699169 RepID=UPI00164F76AD|nr:DUF2796 domain-containing protein [Alkalisalibacterium limincola]